MKAKVKYLTFDKTYIRQVEKFRLGLLPVLSSASRPFHRYRKCSSRAHSRLNYKHIYNHPLGDSTWQLLLLAIEIKSWLALGMHKRA